MSTDVPAWRRIRGAARPIGAAAAGAVIAALALAAPAAANTKTYSCGHGITTQIRMYCPFAREVIAKAKVHNTFLDPDTRIQKVRWQVRRQYTPDPAICGLKMVITATSSIKQGGFGWIRSTEYQGQPCHR